MDGVFDSQQSDTIRIASDEPAFQLTVVLALSGDSVNVYGTDVMDLEQARALAEKTERAKANFLSVMSHEIRTPLNAIRARIRSIYWHQCALLLHPERRAVNPVSSWHRCAEFACSSERTLLPARQRAALPSWKRKTPTLPSGLLRTSGPSRSLRPDLC